MQGTVEAHCSARRTTSGWCTGSPASGRAADARASMASTQKYPTTPTGLREQLRMNPEEAIVDTTVANILLNPEETVILVLRATHHALMTNSFCFSTYVKLDVNIFHFTQK